MRSTRPQSRQKPPAAAEENPAAAAPGAAKTDGRVKRSIVTRKKIVDALTALVYEGHISPTAEQVAGRAVVGLRTVFRHFDDMDSLYREITLDLEAAYMPLARQRLTGTTWQDRLLQSLDLRIDMYDHMAAMHIAGQVHRHESVYLAQNVMQFVSLQRELLRRLLPEAASKNAPLFEALDLQLSIEAWIRLRREQGLSAADARDVVRLGVAGLLATTGLDR
jgi:AcrR family transcriptional regulator